MSFWGFAKDGTPRQTCRVRLRQTFMSNVWQKSAGKFVEGTFCLSMACTGGLDGLRGSCRRRTNCSGFLKGRCGGTFFGRRRCCGFFAPYGRMSWETAGLKTGRRSRFAGSSGLWTTYGCFGCGGATLSRFGRRGRYGFRFSSDGGRGCKGIGLKSAGRFGTVRCRRFTAATKGGSLCFRLATCLCGRFRSSSLRLARCSGKCGSYNGSNCAGSGNSCMQRRFRGCRRGSRFCSGLCSRASGWTGGTRRGFGGQSGRRFRCASFGTVLICFGLRCGTRMGRCKITPWRGFSLTCWHGSFTTLCRSQGPKVCRRACCLGRRRCCFCRRSSLTA